jgi:multiple antibiotic resistance protein
MREVLLAFVALFVSVDVFGLIPLYVNLTNKLPREVRNRLPLRATLTATAVGLGFLLIGDALFRIMGISVGDFQMAGGILLLVLSINDIIHPGKPLRQPTPEVGVVPLGTPLIVGPAVLATLIILVKSSGYAATLIGLGANMLLTFLALRYADKVRRFLGEAGSGALAKVMSLFLAAFGVSLIRRGMPTFSGR